MIRAIAYRLQERRFGEFKPSTQRLLDRVCEGRADVGRKRISDKRVSAGTVLIREWGSVSHRVMVLDHGVVYGGRRYRSLSEVAGVITARAGRDRSSSASAGRVLAPLRWCPGE